jgi:hypothetical protein
LASQTPVPASTAMSGAAINVAGRRTNPEKILVRARMPNTYRLADA